MPSIEEITAAVVAALAADEPKKAPARKTTTRKTTAAKPKKAPAVVASCITAQVAWELLGADENFKPKDGSKPATNAQLWRLNTAGRLNVS